MGIHAEVTCDGCGSARDIDVIYDSAYDAVSNVGWYTSYSNGDFHYCPSCWAEVKKKGEE